MNTVKLWKNMQSELETLYKEMNSLVEKASAIVAAEHKQIIKATWDNLVLFENQK